MTEQKEPAKPTKPLTLSTTAARSGIAAKGDTQVRQKFSHGRTRSVTVEVKKPVKRPGATTTAAPAQVAAPPAAPAAPTGRTLKLGAGAGTATPATPRPATPAPRPPGAGGGTSPGGRGSGIVLR